jgi:hypothetical protein
VRLIGDEIIHVVTYRNEQTGSSDEKAFSVFGGIATVYRQSIDLTLSPHDNINWLNNNLEIYRKRNPFCFDDDMYNKLYKFPYKPDNEDSILCSINRSLEATKQFMLPILNNVTTLNSCIEYFYDFKQPLLSLYENYFGKEYGSDDDSEGRLLIKSNYRDDGLNRMEQNFAETKYLIEEGKSGYNKMYYGYHLKEFEKNAKKVTDID